MPYKPDRPCLFPGCTATVQKGYCLAHQHFYNPPVKQTDLRPTAARRGYDNNWKRIREKVLIDAGIPQNERHLYDVHHTPDYNPEVESDHGRYKLTPMLHREHSKHTKKSKKVNI
jgi:hypothetical protein